MTTSVQSAPSSLLSNVAPSAAAIAANAAGGTGTASAMSTMFTQLLVAQIKNQDPTAPTDPSTYVNQLAQLSQTESLQALSRSNATNAGLLQSLQVLAMGGQVGSTVMASSDTVTLGADKVAGSVTLAASTSKATLVLTGSDGRRHDIALGAQAAGEVAFRLDPVALGLPAGRYDIAVETDAGLAKGAQIAGVLSSVKVGAGGSTTLVVSHLGEVLPSALTRFDGVVPPVP